MEFAIFCYDQLWFEARAMSILGSLFFAFQVDTHFRVPSRQLTITVRSESVRLDGAGVVIAEGMISVNSGYPRSGGMPGYEGPNPDSGVLTNLLFCSMRLGSILQEVVLIL